MVAFANGSGGRIFIGITDDGRKVGVKVKMKYVINIVFEYLKSH
jgi:predicted HTH transcriptional regulator